MIKRNIIAFTTDPYDNIYGYSLVFFRLFNYIQETSPELNIVFASNNGTCSKLINNKNFLIKKMNQKDNLLKKTLFLSLYFIRTALSYDDKSIIVANCEIPELLAAWFLKLRSRDVYCVLPDDRVRYKSIFTRIVCSTRIFLVRRVNNVFFTNEYTMRHFDNSVNKIYLGNPVFIK